MRFCKASLFVLMTVTAFIAHAGVASSEAEAGPLMDFLFRRNRRAVAACPQPVAGCTTCTQTCNRVVASYVPYTAYRTCYEQVPVTYYRRTSSTDPCTGCTITCNKPCTTYRMQAKRVPYTAYRTVYRTETVTTPVTVNYAQQPCSTCPTSHAAQSMTPQYAPAQYAAPSGCSTCTSGNPAANPYNGGYQTVSPATYSPIEPYAPSNGFNGSGGAADTQPSLTPGGFTDSNVTNYPTPADPDKRIDARSVIKDLEEEYREYQDEQNIRLQAPSNNSNDLSDDKPASTRRPYAGGNAPGNNVRGMQPRERSASYAPTQRQWGYSPRLASHRQYDNQPAASRSNSGFDSASRPRTEDHPVYRQQKTQANQGWSSGN